MGVGVEKTIWQERMGRGEEGGWGHQNEASLSPPTHFPFPQWKCSQPGMAFFLQEGAIQFSPPPKWPFLLPRCTQAPKEAYPYLPASTNRDSPADAAVLGKRCFPFAKDIARNGQLEKGRTFHLGYFFEREAQYSIETSTRHNFPSFFAREDV